MDRRLIISLALFGAAAMTAVFWPLALQQACPVAREALERQGFALTQRERETVETFLELFRD